MVPILHDRGKYWTIWAETFRVHTNFSRRFQWKHSGRPQTLDLTQTASQIFLIFYLFFGKIPNKNPGWCLSQIKGLGPSGVLPLESFRKVSMNAESFSPYSPSPYRAKLVPKTSPRPNFWVQLPPPNSRGSPPILGSHSRVSPIPF